MNFKNFKLLDAVELWAEDLNSFSSAGVIESETQLSALFDANILPHVIAEYGEDDEPAIKEAFCNYADSLHQDNLMHDEQTNKYCYVGKLAS
jgi:hypothetical protein